MFDAVAVLTDLLGDSILFSDLQVLESRKWTANKSVGNEHTFRNDLNKNMVIPMDLNPLMT